MDDALPSCPIALPTLAPTTGRYVAQLGSEFGAACFVERKIPWHLSIEEKAERYDRLKLVPVLDGIREGKRQGRAAATPYLFTGIARSQCGGSITVSGRCRKRADSHPRLGR